MKWTVLKIKLFFLRLILRSTRSIKDPELSDILDQMDELQVKFGDILRRRRLSDVK